MNTSFFNSAFPQSFVKKESSVYNKDGNDVNYVSEGLGKLEYFAGLAMQGLLANPMYYDPYNTENRYTSAQNLAIAAKYHAEELLKQLEIKTN